MGDPEVAAALFGGGFSGGGFSLHFQRQSYQDGAVSTFLGHLGKDYAGLYKCVRCRNLTRPLHTLCSPEGRGIPDVAAQADKFRFILNGDNYFMSGTSCSTPVRVPAPYALCRPSSSTRLMANVQTVAGIVALLNDYLLSTDRAPLGFLNIRLYGQAREGLNDITSGSNPGCNTVGFSAIDGWDPVRPPKTSFYFD
jgi:tripeptidyl-peptidase-1